MLRFIRLFITHLASKIKISGITQKIALSVIIIIALVFRLYHLDSRYKFEWDQGDDATKVMSMIQSHKPLLIGPRVASENGFFVGPFHYYFLTPFYLLTSGNPIAGAYASIAVSIATIFVIYFVGANFFNQHTGLLSAFLLAINPSLTSWNVMYTPVLSLLTFYICYKVISQDNRYLPFLFLLLGFGSTTHLVPVSLVLPSFLAIYISRRRLSVIQILSGIAMFSMFFVPIVIFDLRHNFLNTAKLIEFVSPKHIQSHIPWYNFAWVYWKSLTFVNMDFNIIFTLVEKLFLIFSIIYTTLSLTKQKRQLTILWILTPIIIMAFYRNPIPEYYFGAANIFLPVYAAYTFSNIIKNKNVFALAIVIIVVFKVNWLYNDKVLVSISDKMAIARYICQQQRDPVYNISYDLPPGWNVGYQYLFEYYKRVPQDVPEGHLYTLVTLPTPESGELVFHSGVIGLIRK